MKARYLRKLAYIKSEDPYILNTSDLCKDTCISFTSSWVDIRAAYIVQCRARRRSYTIEQAHLSFQLCRYCRVLVTHSQHCNIGGASRTSKVTGISPVGGYT